MEEAYVKKSDCCCSELFLLLNNKEVRAFYDADMRWYSLATICDAGNQTLLYCFCCGKRFPKNLRKEWRSILKKEYKIKDPWEAAYEGTLPSEFMTDEWWKKRGL